MPDIIVIGGGPAGMMAAICAAENGSEVELWDANEKTGKKLYITGKGRCNLTNACSKEDFFKNIPRNRKFLMSSYAAFDNIKLMTFIENLGVPLKVERGERVFPESDKASDITRALNRRMNELNVRVRLNTRCEKIAVTDGRITGAFSGGQETSCQALILATGGLSYPSTGSTGDGFAFARDMGHKIIAPRPSLVPIETEPGWTRELPGLTLKNVRLSAKADGKKIFNETGEMLFAHFGITGPLVLSLSARLPENITDTKVLLDMKPALTPEEVNARVLREFEAAQSKRITNVLRTLLPAAMTVPFAREVAGIDPAEQVNQITRAQRLRVGEALKAVPIPLLRFRPLDEAVITRGGVDTLEVSPRTMESKKTQGLYFAGEMLDIDGYTGGFNLQIAFTTGRAAGVAANRAVSLAEGRV